MFFHDDDVLIFIKDKKIGKLESGKMEKWKDGGDVMMERLRRVMRKKLTGAGLGRSCQSWVRDKSLILNKKISRHFNKLPLQSLPQVSHNLHMLPLNRWFSHLMNTLMSLVKKRSF
ncbi:MAG: hypothetical protein B6I19_06365 [Bacteroidetes bacterium 4572_114]|nr:MAG: hypothetical protein B6I19_06365 [Bacteroidetes bacterium 4572_114]